MNKEQFINELNKIGINATSKMLEQLSIYASFLQKYNEKTNLTTIKNIEDIYLKHFYDSLTIAKIIDLNNQKSLLDIGSGAGFPGMVLKIFYPHLNVTLLDSNNKKTTFLKSLMEKLNLQVDIVSKRAEEYINDYRESYDLVVSRAVAPLPILVELTIPFVKEDGYFIAMKSNILNEINLSKDIVNKLNGSIEKIIEFNLPVEEAKRTLIKIKKNKKTPILYPRRYDKIKKEYENLAKK